MKKSATLPHDPTESEIQHQAYILWQEGGCRDGAELDDWHAAKELVVQHHARSAGPTKRKSAAPALVPVH